MLRFQQYKKKCVAILMAGLIAGLSALPAHATIEADKSSAVIFAYQRIGEDSAPERSLSVEQFRAHIETLTKEGYNVFSLEDIVSALKENRPLPHKSVAITFDGAWQSTLNNAVPLLLKAKLPFTIFFASDMADSETAGHMTVEQIRKLAKNKLAAFGVMPSAYASMVSASADENAALLNKATSRYREIFDRAPLFFAYPYGEYSLAVKKQISGYGFQAAFAQQSGIAHAKSDFNALPRFTLTENYGGLDRFLLTANALPLPVTEVTPEDPVMKENPPMIGFTVTSEIKDLSKLACFISGEGKADLKHIGGNRVEIRPQQPFEARGTRINCTMPDDVFIPGEPEYWRWFGMEIIDTGYDAGTHDDGDQ